jgi:hypothetical protein
MAKTAERRVEERILDQLEWLSWIGECVVLVSMGLRDIKSPGAMLFKKTEACQD